MGGSGVVYCSCGIFSSWINSVEGTLRTKVCSKVGELLMQANYDVWTLSGWMCGVLCWFSGYISG